MNNDIKICNFIDDKMMTTTGEEQKGWVRKYDIFTSRSLFEKFQKNDKLAEVEKIRMELSKYVQ
ncbi:hypothetical protein [Clostridium estertheticum]|uniref:hypothetical protein n=1 Tax=Clostridium estertheticum TaxID=238834 RepID=UPI001C7D19C6|nr:hypothetical protein [Clostridium estertheticum]MBX4267150.1 hypothetical protein [Clostridium estertheticum]MBX4272016.1 hypothetical protein [Clostridium estertheticum]WLC82400.1 hypothetical protein KTC98_24045 [Clostridium estertheticum]WLC91273.1 hypothetical protein KTC95_24015 [Clostridium estertheticum]